MRSCFTIMPFGGYFDGYYANVIKEVILESGFSPLRADEIYGAGAIIDDIYKSISVSSFCIADVTNRNPNVSYELGMAHTLGKPVIIITQNIGDVPFDYSHLRIIHYDPREFGWEESFKKSLSNTISQIVKAPHENLALAMHSSDFKLIKKHLVDIFFNVDCVLSKYDNIMCDEFGHAKITSEWRIKANNDIFHLAHNLVAGKAGSRIDIIEVYDKLDAMKLDTLVIEEAEDRLTYLFMIKNFKRKNQTAVIETKVYVENFLDTLVEQGSATMSHQAARRSKIKYADKRETYFFPKIEKFASLSAEYLSHPVQEKVGLSIMPKVSDRNYILEVEYGNTEPYNQETGVLIKLK